MNKLLAKYVLRWFRANLGKSNFFEWFQQLQNIANEGMVYGNDELLIKAESNLILETAAQFVQKPIVFDVGANVGDYTQLWLKQNAEVHCFEPGKQAFELLVSNYGELATVNNLAFASRTEIKQLYQVADDTRMASLIHRSHTKHVWEKGEKVECDTIDNYCALNSIKTIDFLKIDVEGYEMEVLKGAGKMLANIHRVQFEFGGAHIEQDIYFRDFYALLSPNFKLFHILLDGKVEIKEYDEKLENFKGTNLLAVNKNVL